MARILRSVLAISLLLGCFSLDGFAQKEVDLSTKNSFFDRVYIGGGIGFSSGTWGTQLSLSPLAGYMITQKLSAGVGITYQYYIDKFYDVDDHRYGGKIFVMQGLIYNTFLYAEYNFMNLNPAPQLEDYPRETWTRTLIGGGLSQPLGKAAFNIMVTYDITHNNNSPYGSPWVVGAFISI